ncbi:MAG: hypothetical protein Q9183_004508 [Haloplaca sp. 2 TL-2023]
MTPRGWKRLDDSQEHELYAFESNIYDEAGASRQHDDEGPNPTYGRDKFMSVHDMTPINNPLTHNHSPLALGKPTRKKRVHMLHILTAAISLICLILAITVVANEKVSWALSHNNYQLIALGFLLGIMNLCLGSVTPLLFLHLEARFGPSTLQNYNGILLNQVFSSRLSFVWRLIIGLSLALPLALSVAYKSFTGGESAMMVNASDSIGEATRYGIFAPPGLQHLGQKTGIALFANATLPFAVATSQENDSEPDLPNFPQPYGFNVLLLANESAAVLDIPQPSYISAVQKSLAGGESWNISASVFATVATLNHSAETDQDEYESFFDDFCLAARKSSGAYSKATLMNEWAIVLLNHASPGDQSLQFIGLTPDPGIEQKPDCSEFFPDAQLYDLNRQQCEGTWSITRGGFELVHASCTGTILPLEKQEVIVHNSLFPGVFYMSSLVEFLGVFATSRNGSHWTSPYMATGLAAMLWSRISVLNTPISQNEFKEYEVPDELGRLSTEDAGISYAVEDTAIYIRPTIQKSGALYFIIALQPLLIILILGLTASVFYSAPLGRGFGLISILSGIDRDSLDVLGGAALSGKLTKDVKLSIRSAENEAHEHTVEYAVISR